VKTALADEDVGVLGEEAEDEPRHEVIHVVAALGLAPFGVVLQQLDIEAVEAAGRPDVEGVFADLPDGADARQRQEEAEVVGKVLEGAGDGVAAGQVFGLEVRAVGGEDELRLGLAVAGLAFRALSVCVTCPRRRSGCGCCWSGERRRGRTCSTPRAQALDRRRLVAEGFKEGVGNSAGSNGCSARSVMACSISTAFINRRTRPALSAIT
jgi:hypothetical protein